MLPFFLSSSCLIFSSIMNLFFPAAFLFLFCYFVLCMVSGKSTFFSLDPSNFASIFCIFYTAHLSIQLCSRREMHELFCRVYQIGLEIRDLAGKSTSFSFPLHCKKDLVEPFSFSKYPCALQLKLANLLYCYVVSSSYYSCLCMSASFAQFFSFSYKFILFL